MATAQAALAFMRANLGLAEYPDGSNANWLTDWFGVGHVAWCAITVSRALNEAWGDPDTWQVPGVRRDYAKGVAYVPNLRQYFIASGLYGAEPRVGAVVIYGWTPGSDGDHTGLCEAWVDTAGRARTDEFAAAEWDGTIIALEGNQSNALVRIRRSMDVILGFGYPPYEPAIDGPGGFDPSRWYFMGVHGG